MFKRGKENYYFSDSCHYRDFDISFPFTLFLLQKCYVPLGKKAEAVVIYAVVGKTFLRPT